MPSFKNQRNADLTDERFAGVTSVWVESTRDQKLLEEYLFTDEGENLAFRAADGGEDRGGGGCPAVRRLVDRDRLNGIRAFGLVDRDAVFREDGHSVDELMSIFLESDDGAFQLAISRLASLKHIRVLTAWEIENYLTFDLDVLVHQFRGAAQPDVDKRVLADRLRQLVDLLIPDSAAKVLCHIGRFTQFSRGHDPGLDSRQAVREAIRLHVRKESKGANTWDEAAWEQKMDEMEARVSEFMSDDLDLGRWWRSVARILDGKTLLKRFSVQLWPKKVQRPGDSDMEQLKWLLAAVLFDWKTRRPEVIDDELRQHIISFRPRAA